MTLPSSGIIHMSHIAGEFGRGNNLAAYHGVPWWRDDGSSGTFSTGQISMSDFYGKRATSPVVNGVVSANYVWGGKVAGTGGAIHLGGEAHNRYIVIMASSYSTAANNLDQCYLNGVSLPLLAYDEGSTIDTDANTHYSKVAIFGGYFPSGVDVTAQFKQVGGGNAGGDAYVVHLTGGNLGLRATAVGSGSNLLPMAIPNKSIILGNHAKAKHSTGVAWVGVTQLGAQNSGVDTVKGGWSSAVAWQYYEGGGTVNVRGSGTTSFVAIG